MIREDTGKTLGEEVAAFIPHIFPQKNDLRRFFLKNEIEAETLRLSLKGYKVKLAMTVHARTLVMDMLLTDKFTSLQVPEKIRLIPLERWK